MHPQVPSAGLRLLQQLPEVAPAGRIFTSEDAVVAGREIGLSPGHTYKLLTQLTERGLLERPRTRLYVMKPPVGGILPVRPLAIAVHAVTPAAVSGETALAHWGLLEQAPMHEEVVSTPARIQWAHNLRIEGIDRLWSVGGAIIRFRRIPAEAMIGIVTVRLDSETVVPMFDCERTLVELLTHPALGSADWAGELLRAHRSDISLAQLQSYAEQLNAGGLLRRALRRPRLLTGPDLT
jgi:predicted transcriptional regulator of viral defense system